MPLKLTEEQRSDIADKVFQKRDARNNFWKLNVPMPETPSAPSQPPKESAIEPQ